MPTSGDVNDRAGDGEDDDGEARDRGDAPRQERCAVGVLSSWSGQCADAKCEQGRQTSAKNEPDHDDVANGIPLDEFRHISPLARHVLLLVLLPRNTLLFLVSLFLLTLDAQEPGVVCGDGLRDDGLVVR